MGSVSTKIFTSTNVLVLGTDKQCGTILNAWTGKEKRALKKENGIYSFYNASKGNITIQGLPEPHGRFPVYRSTTKAIAEANAYMIVVGANATKRDIRYHYERITRDWKAKSPVLLLLLYTFNNPSPSQPPYPNDLVVDYEFFRLPRTPSVSDDIVEWAKSVGVGIQFINTAMLYYNVPEKAKLTKYIKQLAAATLAPGSQLPPTEVSLSPSASPPSSTPSPTPPPSTPSPTPPSSTPSPTPPSSTIPLLSSATKTTTQENPEGMLPPLLGSSAA